MPRVAGIIVNLVPYHHARWDAFSRQSGVACHLIELTDRDAFKVLEFSAASSYRRHTLFPRADSEAVTKIALKQRMAAQLDAIQPDVVCVSGWALPVSLAALAWAAEHRVTVVMLSESNEWDQTRSAWREAVKSRMVKLSSAALAGGTPQKEYLAKLGLARDRIFAGYDAVDNEYFREKADILKAEISNRFGLPQEYFLACARFGEKKNLPRLIEAYARYRELVSAARSGKPKVESTGASSGRRPPFPQSGAGDSEMENRKSEIWDLVIAGEGEMRPEIEAVIGRCGVTASVQLVGAKSYVEMPTLYGLASAFVHASTTEQWGLVVNEAMASGLPVLVSNRCGCAKDLVQEGMNGFTFDPYNVEELAQLMFKISAFNFPVSAFGRESRRIISNWGPERFASGLKQAMDCALNVGPAKPALMQRLILRALLAR